MSKTFPELFVSVEKVVPTSADRIFELLADPARHSEIDGSGSVKKSLVETPQRLTMGAKFGMSMKLGVPYKITNTVIELAPLRWSHMAIHLGTHR
jgi:hypothetical protein